MSKLLGILLLAAIAGAAPGYPGKVWEKRRPRTWSAAKLQAVREYASTLKTAAVMIVHDGAVVDEWGDTTKKYMSHSMRKSLLSALYGIHAAEGTIRMESTLEELGIDDNEPSLTATEKKATVGDLLMARSGIYHPALYETSSMKIAKPPRGSHQPGTFWHYNNWDFNALGTIFEKQTGSSLFDEFDRRIARPIDMEDFQPSDGEHVRGADSIHAAYPFKISTRDLARFGLLYARNGNWRGRQVVPSDWVARSTKPYSKTGRGSDGGYGFMWWTQADYYQAAGAGGHYVTVVPAIDLVVVHRVDTFVTGNSVSGEQYQTLLHKIADASGRPDLIPLPVAQPQKPCDQAASECMERLLAGDRQIWIYRNFSPQLGTHRDLTSAVILVHGAGRDADRYFRAALASAAAAGHFHDTLLIAPDFKGNTGSGTCRDQAEPGEAVWDCNGWKYGEASRNSPLTSFDFMDRLLVLLSDRSRFPKLQHIVVAGHSAGGQFVQRYAAGNRAEPKVPMPVRYVVANPSSYVYLSNLRLASQGSCQESGACTATFVPYWDGENCTAFNQYRYGLDNLTGYLKDSPADRIRHQFPQRNVTYLVGELDTLADAQLDRTCAAMSQGTNRRERGVIFWNYMRQQFQAKHQLKIVNGCGHSAVCMFASPAGIQAVFGK